MTTPATPYELAFAELRGQKLDPIRFEDEYPFQAAFLMEFYQSGRRHGELIFTHEGLCFTDKKSYDLYRLLVPFQKA